MTITKLKTDRRSLLLGAAGLGVSLPFYSQARGQTALPAVDALLKQIVEAQRLPGLVVGLQQRGQPALFVQAGQTDFGSPHRVDQDSLVRLYSMTKLITGTATALLIEDGKLALDQPIATLVPELAQPTVFVRKDRHLITEGAKNPITIRHLLSHTSGFAGDQSRDSPVYNLYRQAGLNPGSDQPPIDLEDLVTRLGQLPLNRQPGTGYDYGPSLDVLGLVLQRASNQPLPDLIQQRILTPLGMADTGWRLRPQDQDRLMALYTYRQDQPPQDPPSSATPTALMQPTRLYLGGSGLLSSASDYMKFLAMLLNHGAGLMKPQTAQLIRSDILPADLSALGSGHGFGGWVARPDHRRAGEFGWSGTASTQAWIDPAKGFAAVLMMQALPYRSVDVLTPLRAAIDQDLGINRV